MGRNQRGGPPGGSVVIAGDAADRGGAACSRTVAWLWLPMLLGATILCYSNTLEVPFLLDDYAAIVGNDALREPSAIGSWLHPPVAGTTAGRPVLQATYLANYGWSRLSLPGYHVVNLGLHLLAGLLLFGILRRLLVRRADGTAGAVGAEWSALGCAAVWLLHPLQTAAVTYVSQRAEVLAGVFYLATVYGFVRAQGTRAPGNWLVASVVCCLLGVATKEVVITAPVLVWCLDWAMFGRSVVAIWRDRKYYYAGLGTAWLAFAWLAQDSRLWERGIGTGAEIGGLAYAVVESRVIVGYLRLVFWPGPLVFDYGTQLLQANLWPLVPSAVAVVIALYVSLRLFLRRSLPGLAGVALFVLLSPHSSFVPVQGQPMAESRMYLALAPALMLALVPLARLGRRGFAGLVALMAVTCAWGTYARNEVYRSARSIWEDTVAKVPGNARAFVQLGDVCASEHDDDRAVRCYATAISLDSGGSSEAHNNLGIVLDRTPGRERDAQWHWRVAVKVDPINPEAHYNLANSLARTRGGIVEAIRHYQRAVALRAGYFEAHNNLAAVLARVGGREPEALQHLEIAAALRPRDVVVRYNLAIALLRSGQIEQARRQFEAVIALEPAFELAKERLAQIAATNPAPGR